MAGTTSSYDLEILLANGTTWRGFMLAPEYDNQGKPLPKTLAEILAAQDDDRSIRKRLTEVYQADFSGGIGISYNQAPGVYTRTPGYALPAGSLLSSTSPVLAGQTTNKVVAFAEFAGNLYIADQGGALGGRVLVFTGGTGTPTVSLDLASGRYIHDLLAYDDGAVGGTKYLYMSSCDVNGLNGELHRTSDGVNWVASGTVYGTSGRRRLVKWFSVDEFGIGDWRMACISGDASISYTVPGGSPFTALDWIDDVRIATAYTLLEITAAKEVMFFSAKDGCWSIDGLGNSTNHMSYIMPHEGNGVAIQYHDGYVYMSVGQGLERVRVEQLGVRQENPGQCAPGWGTHAENEIRGYSTAMMVDQGYLVDSVYNPSTQKSYLCWGKDRTILGVETPNPLVWYGPEVVAGSNHQVTRLHSSTLTGSLRLWIASQAVSGGAGWISSVSLPIAGSPLQDLISGGGHKFTDGNNVGIFQTYSRLELMSESFGDYVAKKSVHEHGFKTRGLADPVGTKLVLETRADPVPGQTTWTTSTDITASPVSNNVPDPAVNGYAIERRIGFFAPSGAASTPKVPVLDAIRVTGWVIAPSFPVRIFSIQHGDGVTDRKNGHDDNFDPDQITDELTILTDGYRTQMRDAQDKRWHVRLEQVLDRKEELGTGVYGKMVTTRVEITVLGQVTP